MDKTRWNEIQGVVFFAVALLIFISLITFDFFDMGLFVSKPNIPVKNFAGLFGAYLAGLLLFIMGLSAYVIPLLVFSWAVARFFGVTPQKLYFKLFGTLFLVLATSSLFAILGRGDNAFRFNLGGIVGLVSSDFLIKYLGYGGAFVVIVVLFLLSLLLATEFLLLPFLVNVFGRFRKASEAIAREREPQLFNAKRPKIKIKAEGRELKEPKDGPKIAQAPVIKREPIIAKKPTPPPPPVVKVHKEGVTKPVTAEKPRIDATGYKLPAIDLLDAPPPIESRKIQEDFEANARILEETLRDFEIEAKVVEINKGPVITRYELEPAPGIKIQKVTSLSDNIALAMKAQSVRIVAPVPGKGTIGIEVPNSVSALVYLRDVLESNEYKQAKGKLKLALGKDIAGAPVIADLTTMPHILIAGATGSGKTVCINSVITSLLFAYSPDELKFIMVDPKRVELAVFNDLPHLLCPVVTDSKKSPGTLEWVVSTMDSRYELLAQSGTRDIARYNEKLGKDSKDRLPYIIVVIDELADLMMVAQQDVETTITRLAQLSRAVGIHIIIATQRPSVDVITGVIKANLPARISFKVASKVDSRTVLDMNGADKLLGRGDMLFIEPGASKPVRAQCSLISDKEIERITSFIKAQRGPQYVEEIEEEAKKPSFKKFEKDEVYGEAVRCVLDTGQASVSMLQRRLGLGYTRAARLIDMMEDDGIVGPYQGSKPRDIMMTLEEFQAKNGTA